MPMMVSEPIGVSNALASGGFDLGYAGLPKTCNQRLAQGCVEFAADWLRHFRFRGR